MIPKSGHRFSEKIVPSSRSRERDDDSKKSHLALGINRIKTRYRSRVVSALRQTTLDITMTVYLIQAVNLVHWSAPLE
jgi:hypothetical protein